MKPLIIFSLSIFIASAYAQPCKVISGIVWDSESNYPLPGANVRLQSNWRVGSSTDSLGQFQLPYLVGDTLVVSFIGYEDVLLPIKTTCEVTIRLIPSLKLTGEIVIKAERLIAEEFRTMNANKLQIYTNPVAKADPLLAVNSMPAATTLDESANISLRGSTSQETGIFLNSVPIYDGIRYGQLNGIGTFSIFNTTIINSLQVYSGNPPLEYGNTSSGLIALQTEAIVPKKAATQVSLTMANVGASVSLPLNTKSSLSAFSNYQFSGLLRNLNEKALERIKKFSSVDAGLHYFLKISDKTLLRVFNYSLSESFTFDYRHPTFQGNFMAKKKRNFTTVSFQKHFGRGELSINQGASFYKANFEFSRSDIELGNQDFYSSINYASIGESFDFKVGISHDNRQQEFIGTLPMFSYAVAPTHPFFSTRSATRIPLTEVYGYGKYRLKEKLLVGLGARQGIPTSNQVQYTSGQINLKWLTSEHLSWLLGAGKYHRTDFSRVDVNPVIRFETHQLSLDAMYNNHAWEMAGSVFTKRSNTGSELRKTYGIEGFIKYKSNHIIAEASMSSLHSVVTVNETTYASPFDLTYFGRVNFQYKFRSSWTVSLFSLFRQGSFYNPVASVHFDEQYQVFEPAFVPIVDQQRLPNYLNVSMNISRLITLSEKVMMIAFVSVDNLTNHVNVRGYEYNFDYTKRNEDKFAQRTAFIGCVMNF